MKGEGEDGELHLGCCLRSNLFSFGILCFRNCLRFECLCFCVQVLLFRTLAFSVLVFLLMLRLTGEIPFRRKEGTSYIISFISFSYCMPSADARN